MQIIISILLIGLLWMIYDLINAPEVDEDENFVYSDSEDDEDYIEAEQEYPGEEEQSPPDSIELPERKQTKVK